MATITFPNDIVWAYNPNYVKIKDAGTATKATVSVSGKQIDVALYGGSADVYITRLLQLLFTAPSSTRLVNANISVTIGEETWNKQVSVIWGSIEITDKFCSFGNADREWQERNVYYFKGYPFSINLLLAANTSLSIRTDNGGYGVRKNIFTTQMSDFDVTDYEFERSLVFRQDIASDANVFDDTFDYTFRTPADTTVITRIHVRNEKEGYYLRWIDRFGYMQYYLFAKGELTSKTKISDDTISKDALNAKDVLVSTNVRPLAIETSQAVTACAVNLDKETFAYVSSVVSSPIVDLYVGQRANGTPIWMPVNIASSSFKDDVRCSAVLQDLEITLTLPNRITQSL